MPTPHSSPFTSPVTVRKRKPGAAAAERAVVAVTTAAVISSAVAASVSRGGGAIASSSRRVPFSSSQPSKPAQGDPSGSLGGRANDKFVAGPSDRYIEEPEVFRVLKHAFPCLLV